VQALPALRGQLMKIKNLQKIMTEKNIDGALIASNANLLYFTGTVPSGYLYIPSVGESVLFLKRPTAELSGVSIYKPEQIPEIIKNKGVKMPGTLLLEEDSISAGEYMRLSGVFENAKIINGGNILRELRAVKTDDEVEKLIKTAEIQAEIYKTIPDIFRIGMTDLALSIELERQARLCGHLGIFRIYGLKMEAFMGSILAGNNAVGISPYDFALGGRGQHPSLPFGANGTKIEGNMTVMVDMSCNLFGYVTDMTRTYCVGVLPDYIYKAHNVSIEIQNEISNAAKPGVTGEELYNKALEIVNKNNLQEHFMGLKYQSKFVGHGLGIEINELPVLAPRSKMELKENMAIALEPKFVFEEYGAAGTENTYIVRKNGLEKITLFEENIIKLD